MTSRARVFSIPTGAPFLATLADALLAGRIVPGFPVAGDPLSLSRATIFLPTRRAARAFAALLAERFAPAPVLLPRLVPLGDLDDAELSLAGDEVFPDTNGGAASSDDFLPALGETTRRLILTRLVLSWAKAVERALLRLDEREPLLVPASPADALALAGDLARLMDALTTGDVPWSALEGLVDERHSRYFAITLTFLKIAAEQWPEILAERGASDPVLRRHRLTLAEAARLRRKGPAQEQRASGPMIVAGSTGSVPATAELIAAIAHLPQGTVVLPGLDRDLDATSWATLANGGGAQDHHGHPQAILFQLLQTIGLARDDVDDLAATPAALLGRRKFVSEALRPAETTHLWHARRAEATAGGQVLAGVALVEAPDERTEALAAAIALREVLDTPGRTAALITPDRALAERVTAELKRWGIEAEDSAGLPLSRSEAGALARLVAEVAANGFEPASLLALLAHPRATFGLERAEVERAAMALEIGVLRGPAPPPGLVGLMAVLPVRRDAAADWRASRPLAALTPEDWECAAGLLQGLQGAFAQFQPSAFSDKPATDLVALAASHAQALACVAATPEHGPALPQGQGAEELSALFDDMAAATPSGIMGRFADYPALFNGLAAERVTRRKGAAHARIRIWGLLEARLLEVDRVVLGGLDEGVWPPKVRTDAFLNRPMRTAVGLPPPERRIGQTAHDFAEALGLPDVVVTRSLKRENAPTVPSRFLQRMKALAGDALWQAPLVRGRRFIQLAEQLDAPLAVEPLRAPRPLPPLDLLPTGLSVTEIETLVRDPYSIFARHVLKLDPIDGLAVPPGASDRGTIIHDALGRFAGEWPRDLPPDPLEIVLRLGREAFAPLEVYPEIAALWWPRFVQIARAFVVWEQERRPLISRVHAEISGRIELPLSNGRIFKLRARADRIEEHSDGSAVIIDFKTGQPPSGKQVFAGFSPQMTLEAAMLMRSGFSGIASPVEVPDLLYMHAPGGADPLRPKPVKPPPGEERTVAELVAEHMAGLKALLTRYYTGEAAFVSRPYAEYARREGDYDHLARVREWSVMADRGEDA